MAKIEQGQRRISVIKMTYLTIGYITGAAAAVAVIQPTGAAAIAGALAAAFGAVGAAATLYFGADGYTKAKSPNANDAK